jgi:alkylation response protein AidB-like acyl-CoA dehydrogenase
MERRLVYAATVLALGSSAYDYAVDYATRRRTFGKHICQHQAVALHIADMAAALEMGRLLTLDVATALAAGRAHASVQATWRIARDAAMNVAVQAVQMLGGHGLLTAHPVERLLRDICTVAALGAESP